MSVSSVSVLLMNGSSSSWWNLGLFDTSFVRLSERKREIKKEERKGDADPWVLQSSNVVVLTELKSLTINMK